MKCFFKEDQDWSIKDPQKLKTITADKCPEGYIEDGLAKWKGAKNEVQKGSVSDAESKRPTQTRKNRKAEPKEG